MATWGPTAIAANGDDGHRLGSDWFASQCYMGKDVADSFDSGFRFLNVTVLAGSTIDSATLTIRSRATQTAATDTHFTVAGDDVDDAAAWSATSRPDQITQTTATVAWNPAAWVNDTAYGITITSIIAEIVARAGWASGNDLRLAVLDNGSSNSVVLRAWDFSDEYGIATLTIAYTAASGGLTFAATDAQGTQADATSGFRTMAATVTDNLNA